MPSDVHIQLAQTADHLRAAAHVIWQTFETEHPALSSAEAEAVLQRPGYFIFIARTPAGEAVGAATVQVVLTSDFRQQEALLWDLAVLPTHQRQGIGRALVAHVRQWAVEQGLSATFVLAEGEDADAIAFYRRLPGADEAEVRMFSL